jgi:bifunctional UDP-N-acetylglucosamine pyrophosphorylase/glucosamine-1-phosphate N-acetyltransferase
MPSLHVIVLAAGKGKRMRSDLPKVLHHLAGRPLLAHVIDTVRALDAAVIHIVHGHEGDQVRSRFDDASLCWVEQADQLGTGHAAMQAMPGIPDDATVLILCGDVPLVSLETLRWVTAPAADNKVGLVTAVLDDPGGLGRILRDDSGRVSGIIEDKDADDEQRAIKEINTGIIAAPASMLRTWLIELGNDNSQREYYLPDVISRAVGDGIEVQTVSPQSPDETLGVNDCLELSRLERIYQRRQSEALMRSGVTLYDPARLDVRGRVDAGQDVSIDVNVVLEGQVRIGDRVSIGSNCVLKDVEIGADTQILPNCIIESASVGAHCRVGPYARIRPGTRLDESVHIGNFVEVKATTVGAGSKANHLTYLGDTEIGREVNVGAGTITCNYDGASKHRTIIEDGAFIGSGVELVAPVKVHAGATIGAGSTISKDAPKDKLTVTRGKQVTLKQWKRPGKG